MFSRRSTIRQLCSRVCLCEVPLLHLPHGGNVMSKFCFYNPPLGEMSLQSSASAKLCSGGNVVMKFCFSNSAQKIKSCEVPLSQIRSGVMVSQSSFANITPPPFNITQPPTYYLNMIFVLSYMKDEPEKKWHKRSFGDHIL